MAGRRDIVITGMGLATPLGIGIAPFWDSLLTGRSGIGPLTLCDLGSALPCIAGEVRDFNAQLYVKPRKSLKIMPRDSQLALTAAVLAREDALLGDNAIDPTRLGVTSGADTINPTLADASQTYIPCLVDGEFDLSLWGERGLPGTFPLNMLKMLPNMTGCHISIAQDARGPNNTIYNGEVSSLLALAEAVSVLERGAADVMLTGGASSRMQPLDWARALNMLELSRRYDDPAGACRPFAADRDGMVRSEGAATFVLEDRRHATARGAPILARIAGWGSSCNVRGDTPGTGLARAIVAALRAADLKACDIGHINAHGLATIAADRIEARVLAELLPDIPVTAPKSYFGNLCAAGGAVEAAVSLLAFRHDWLAPTLNHQRADRDYPLRVVTEPLTGLKRTALLVNFTPAGQAAALVLTAD